MIKFSNCRKWLVNLEKMKVLHHLEVDPWSLKLLLGWGWNLHWPELDLFVTLSFLSPFLLVNSEHWAGIVSASVVFLAMECTKTKFKTCLTLKMWLPQIKRQLPETSKAVGMLEKELLRVDSFLTVSPFWSPDTICSGLSEVSPYSVEVQFSEHNSKHALKKHVGRMWVFLKIWPEAHLVMPIFCTVGYCLEPLYGNNKALVSDLLYLKAFIPITYFHYL